jgi:hypothetical protein
MAIRCHYPDSLGCAGRGGLLVHGISDYIKCRGEGRTAIKERWTVYVYVMYRARAVRNGPHTFPGKTVLPS